QREGGVLWPMTGGVKRLDTHRSELQLPAVIDRVVLVVGSGVAVDVDRRPGGRGEPAVPGQMVRVVVCLEDVLDPDVEIARELEVLVDGEARIDHRCDAGLVVADQV
ncbi:MAG: hypothetical protein QOJ29_2326, partial [Thermoleophilaceae bacterium]|nr:hypothetical protein [Thermoleophilaceae bacterium]